MGAWAATYTIFLIFLFRCFIKYIYSILCVKFLCEVRYFTSKVAIISLSALVVRKVTGSEIIGFSVRKTMRKVPGDDRRTTRGRRKSGEERRGGHQERSSSSSFDKQNKQFSKHQTKFVFFRIIVFCLCQVFWRPNYTSCSIKIIFFRENKLRKIPANWNSKQFFRYITLVMYYTLEL